MKKVIQSLLLILLTAGIAMPVVAAEETSQIRKPFFKNLSIAKKVTSFVPQRTLLGFQAAKKWAQRGTLNKEEQAAFNQLKKRAAISAFVGTVLLALGITTWWEYKKWKESIIWDRVGQTQAYFSLSFDDWSKREQKTVDQEKREQKERKFRSWMIDRWIRMKKDTSMDWK